MGECGVVLYLGYEPTPGQMVIEDDRIAAIRERRRASTELAETAKSCPKCVDRRWPELQCTARFVIDCERHVHHLHELRGADGAIRVRGDERKTEQIAIVLRTLSIEAQESGRARKRPCERRRDRVRVGVVHHLAAATRCTNLPAPPPHLHR